MRKGEKTSTKSRDCKYFYGHIIEKFEDGSTTNTLAENSDICKTCIRFRNCHCKDNYKFSNKNYELESK